MTEQTVAPEKTLGATLLPMEEFVAAIYDVGKNFYHDKHPLHRRMYQGKLSKEEIQGWVANRFYYQTQILWQQILQRQNFFWRMKYQHYTECTKCQRRKN